MKGGRDAGQKRASQKIKGRIAVMQRGAGDIMKGHEVTYTLSDGKKIQKVTDVVTGTGSVVRAVSFQHRQGGDEDDYFGGGREVVFTSLSVRNTRGRL